MASFMHKASFSMRGYIAVASLSLSLPCCQRIQRDSFHAENRQSSLSTIWNRAVTYPSSLDQGEENNTFLFVTYKRSLCCDMDGRVVAQSFSATNLLWSLLSKINSAQHSASLVL